MTTQNKPVPLPTHKATPIEGQDDPNSHLAAYVRPVLIGIVVVIVVSTAYAFWRSNSENRSTSQWSEFNRAFYEATLSGAPDRLSDVGERYPQSKAGLYATQTAADMYMQRAIGEQLSMPDAARRDIEKAKEKYERIVQAKLEKSDLLYQQSLFSLGYACEMLKEIDEAHQLYKDLLSVDPDSPYAGLARRGLLRCKVAEATDFYTAFAEYDIDFGQTAPGEALPERPEIDYFSEVTLPVVPPETQSQPLRDNPPSTEPKKATESNGNSGQSTPEIPGK